MKRILFCAGLMMMVATGNVVASPVEETVTAISEVEMGVNAIKRICPTLIWDGWKFRDIVYDKESDSVEMVIQLTSTLSEDKMKQLSNSDKAKKEMADWIIANLNEGYEDLKANPRIMADGDFMLYLSVGTLLKQMEKDNVSLHINFLAPDGTTQIFLSDINKRIS